MYFEDLEGTIPVSVVVDGSEYSSIIIQVSGNVYEVENEFANSFFVNLDSLQIWGVFHGLEVDISTQQLEMALKFDKDNQKAQFLALNTKLDYWKAWHDLIQDPKIKRELTGKN